MSTFVTFAPTITSAKGDVEIVSDPGRDICLGVLIAALFFVAFLGWAAFARLDAAAVASGTLSVSGQRQAVQHRDGGVIGQLAVKEGQVVQRGQLLLRIAAPEVEAQERALTSQAIRLLAIRARQEAEQENLSEIRAPGEFALFSEEDRAEGMRVLAVQLKEMRARAATLTTQQGALGQRGSQSDAQRLGYDSQMRSTTEQIRLLDEQLEQLRPLAEKGFVSQTRMRELERARAALEGERGQYGAMMEQSRSATRESRLQALGAAQSFRETTASELQKVEIQLGEVLPKLLAAREQLARTGVRAPVTGTVVGLSIFTRGGVVTPGQKLMDIVPARQPLVVQARIAPQEADDVHAGLRAEVRLSGVSVRRNQPLNGVVTRISADSFVDERSGASYYTVEVEVPQSELAAGGASHLRAGMPVDILIPLRRRTALQYFLEPLSSQFWSAMHEH